MASGVVTGRAERGKGAILSRLWLPLALKAEFYVRAAEKYFTAYIK